MANSTSEIISKSRDEFVRFLEACNLNGTIEIQVSDTMSDRGKCDRPPSSIINNVLIPNFLTGNGHMTIWIKSYKENKHTNGQQISWNCNFFDFTSFKMQRLLWHEFMHGIGMGWNHCLQPCPSDYRTQHCIPTLWETLMTDEYGNRQYCQKKKLFIAGVELTKDSFHVRGNSLYGYERPWEHCEGLSNDDVKLLHAMNYNCGIATYPTRIVGVTVSLVGLIVVGLILFKLVCYKKSQINPTIEKDIV